MKLVAVYFRSGVSVTVGGRFAALTSWQADKHGSEVTCELQKNGDAWLTTKDGRRRIVRWSAIDHEAWEPDVIVKQDTMVRRAQ